MLIKAEQKFIRTSPIKLRYVVRSLRGVKSPAKLLARLDYVPSRAALPLSKVIKQAVANAKNNLSLSEDSLLIKQIMINEGPTFRRGQPVSKGRFHPIHKKTAHIRVILESIEKKAEKISMKNEVRSMEDGKDVATKQIEAPVKKVESKERKARGTKS